MSRFVLIRRDDEKPQLVSETAILTEAALHDALTDHPQLIPATDLGFGATLAVGRESGLASGYADLVLLDEHGQLAVVEVKKEGNPDTRRVTAQLLDYAAALWGASLDDFERVVLRPFLGDDDSRSLRDFVRDRFGAVETNTREDPEAMADVVLRGLEQSLASGAMTLVVAAPSIPPGVQRVLEYLNAQGLRLFGIEVSYFKGPVEAFVPRVVVRPGAADPAATPAGGTRSPIDAQTFLPRLPEALRDPVLIFLADAAKRGGDVQWTSYGVRVQATASKKVLATLDDNFLWVALVPRQAFPPAPFEIARAALDAVGIGSAKKEWFSARWSKLSTDQLKLILDIVLHLVEAPGPGPGPRTPTI